MKFSEIEIEPRNTKHQVARGSRADAETSSRLILIKRVGELRATYQIKLLTFLAAKSGKLLLVETPKNCILHETLLEWVKKHRRFVQIVRN